MNKYIIQYKNVTQVTSYIINMYLIIVINSIISGIIEYLEKVKNLFLAWLNPILII